MAGWIHLEATKQHGNRQEKSWDDDGAKYTDAGFMIEEVPQLPWAASMRYVLCCAVLPSPLGQATNHGDERNEKQRTRARLWSSQEWTYSENVGVTLHGTFDFGYRNFESAIV